VNSLRRLPLHPILFGAYPTLALLAHNVGQVRPSESVRALIASILGTIICLLILKIFLRDWRKAALSCTFIVILFFSYGHVYENLRQINHIGQVFGRHRYLIPVWLGILGLGLFWIVKRIREVKSITLALNIASIAVLVIPIYRISLFEARLSISQSQAESRATERCDKGFKPTGVPPDIYYIILDAYTRGDVFQEIYDFNNDPFLDNLSQMGFYVAQKSQSNYGVTGLSLSSSLNMNYIQLDNDRFYTAESPDRTTMGGLLTRSLVRQNLECLGYVVITFDSGYYWSGWRDADIFFDPTSAAIEKLERAGGVNAFESMLIENSAGRLITDTATLLPEFTAAVIETPYREYRDRVLYLLDSLEKVVPKLEGPKFVFAHVIPPHPPFVFGPNGEVIEQSGAFTLNDTDWEMQFEERAALYTGQVMFDNKHIERVVEEILKESKTPPIIIIQGDHGLDGPLASQMSILNAYYLPDGGDQLLYETISPVNTFRIIFDYYFGGNYGLIEDISYYSRHADLFNFTIVPNEFSTQEE
jgi:hypothetical protein